MILCDAVLALEVGHVADLGTAEGVDALVIVADRENPLHRRAAARWREHLQPRVLQPVGVLEFIDQHVPKALLVVLAQRVVVAQQFVGAQHQLGEVDHALALALVFVGLVDLDQLARMLVAHLDILRPTTVFLRAGDEPADLLGGEAVLVELHRLDDALDGALRILHVEDLEALRQRGQLPVRAQEAVAQAVEGADPHPAHVHRQHVLQARQHFLGRLVGERDRQHAPGRDLARVQQPGDAGGQHTCLARAGTGEDQRGFGRQRDRGQLLCIQVLQQLGGGRCRCAVIARLHIVHRPILGACCPVACRVE